MLDQLTWFFHLHLSLKHASQSLGICKKMEDMKATVEVNAHHIDQEVADCKEEEHAWPSKIQTTSVIGTEDTKSSSSPGLKNGRVAENFSFESGDSKPDVASVEVMAGGANGVEMCGSIGQSGYISHGKLMFPNNCCFLAELQASPCQPPNFWWLNLLTPGERCPEEDLTLKEESRNKTISLASNRALSLKKIESIPENLSHLRMIESDSVDFRNGFHDDKQQLHLDICVASKDSPIRAYMCRRKGKEKAISNGHVDGRALKVDDDSHESVESCDSGAFFNAGNRQLLSSEQPWIVESKRVEQKIQKRHGSTSFNRRDNSFMNWICNMIKGLPPDTEEKVPSLALSLANVNNGNENQGLPTCSQEQHHKSSSVGFQSFFQSLYRSNHKVQDQKILHADQTSESCQELEFVKKANDVCGSSQIIREDDPEPRKCNLLLTARFNQSALGDGKNPLIHTKTSDENVADFQHGHPTYSSYIFSHNHASDESKDRVCSHNSSLGKRKADSGNSTFDLQSEAKGGCSLVYRKELLSSFWVTHFCPKTSGPLVNLVDCKQSTVGVVECSDFHIDSSKVGERLGSQECAFKRPRNTVSKKLQNCAVDNEASCSSRRMEGQYINHIVCSQRFKSSEAMASVFAKRLDAMKQISPSDLTDEASHTETTCLFCGVRGHESRDCSQITEVELEDLLKNVSAYRVAEKTPCLCIRCFQLNHWAVACPNESSRKRHRLGNGDAFLGRFKRNLQLLENIDSQTQVVREHIAPDSGANCFKRPRNECRINQDMFAASTSGRRISTANSNPDEFTGKEYVEGVSELPMLTNLCHAVSGHMGGVPKGIFEAVKKLRLSRKDILKWVNSNLSFSRLDGYYMRVRLGKREGTGYHVACITGAQGERSPETSERPIYVCIGGMRCFVGSQHVSNQDFVEDELMAWWSATSRGGGKVPSEEDLRVKLEERVRFGL